MSSVTDSKAVAIPGEVDAHVQKVIAGTGGYMYRGLVGRLPAYPIPTLRMTPRMDGGRFLDIGCNWGRWTIAAGRRGFRPVGVDRSLGAIRAARRVARHLGSAAHYVVADARQLPFRAGTFDVAFSYSVWQHLDKRDVHSAIREVSQVLTPEGQAAIQMANVYGLRSLFHQVRRGFRPPRGVEVRYWRPTELRRAFERAIGPTTILADGYLSLNPQAADRLLLPRRFRWVVALSDALRSVSARLPWLANVADSVIVSACRQQASASHHARRIL